MSPREILLREIDQMPEELIGEVVDFVKFLRQKKYNDKLDIPLASESSLKKDWLLPEEDDAWQHL